MIFGLPFDVFFHPDYDSEMPEEKAAELIRDRMFERHCVKADATAVLLGMPESPENTEEMK